MPDTTRLALQLASSTTPGKEGNTGQVYVALQTEGLASIQTLMPVTSNVKTYGGSSTVTNLPEFATISHQITTPACLLDTDQLFYVLSMHLGIANGTISAEGTTKKIVFSGANPPDPVVVTESHGTVAATTARYEYGYLSTCSFGASSPESYVFWNLGWQGQYQTLKVANPTLTYKTTVGMPMLSYVSTRRTILSFTPTGGAATDYTQWLRNFTFDMSRSVTPLEGNLQDAGQIQELPSYSPIIIPKLDFGGSVDPNNPDTTAVAHGYGDKDGTLPTVATYGMEGVLTLTCIGGVTAGDATKYHTITVSGNARSSAGIQGSQLTGSFQFLEFPTITVIGSGAVTSVAKPTIV